MDGINQVANAVKITLGPKGRNVVLERNYGAPEIVNDGVTIARDISLEDPEENVGAKLVQEVAQKSDNRYTPQSDQLHSLKPFAHVEGRWCVSSCCNAHRSPLLLLLTRPSCCCCRAGDGTTTSTLMTQSIVNLGIKSITAGANPVEVRYGIMKAADFLVKEIKELAKPVSGTADLLNIATIASGSATMGTVISQAFEKVGENGSTVVEESQTLSDEIDFTEGLTIDRGYLSPYFVNDNERQVCEMSKPKILVTDKKIEQV